MIKKLITLWNAETPKIARFLQIALAATSTAILYYKDLPEEWKALFPGATGKYISIAGFSLTFLLQFTTKKSNQ